MTWTAADEERSRAIKERLKREHDEHVAARAARRKAENAARRLRPQPAECRRCGNEFMRQRPGDVHCSGCQPSLMDLMIAK